MVLNLFQETEAAGERSQRRVIGLISYSCTKHWTFFSKKGSLHTIPWNMERLYQENDIRYISYIKSSRTSMTKPFDGKLLMIKKYRRCLLSDMELGQMQQ